MAFGLEIPAIVSIVGATAAIAGTGIATVAAVNQAKQQSYAAQAQANEIDVNNQINQQIIEENQRTNQTIADAEAQNQISAAAYDEHQFRRRVALLMGKQAAIYGASGVDPSAGSPLVMTLDAVRQAEMEAQNIRRSGQMGADAALFGAGASARAAQLQINARSRASEFESGLQRWVSRNTSSQIPFQALGGGLTAFGQGTSALSSWMRPTRYYTPGAPANPDYRTSYR